MPIVGNRPVLVTLQLSRPQAELLTEIIDPDEYDQPTQNDLARIRRKLDEAMR